MTGVFRGWADLTAIRLAEETTRLPLREPRDPWAPLRQHRRGAVATDPAHAARPCQFAAGGNDALRRGFQPAALIARLDEVVGTLRAAGAGVLLFRFADVTSRLPGQRMILPRVQVLNAAVGAIAEKHGAMLVDLYADQEFHNPALWSGDRLHMNAIGHRRVAAHVLTALGVKPDQTWFDVPPRPPRVSWVAARAADARWTRQHLAPWIKRRLTGRSSGDNITAKQPILAPVQLD